MSVDLNGRFGDSMVENLIHVMEKAVTTLKNYPSSKVTLYHHNDTDGLSSGTVLLNAFIKTGYEISRCALEKPYPQILEIILGKKDQIIIFADFAGKIAPIISKINNGKNLVIILDHHPAEETEDTSVYNLDGELYNLKGDRDISASATCYLFADVLLRSFGLDGEMYSHLGVLGAIGDGFLVNGALSGVNRDILSIAVSRGLILVKNTGKGEQYSINLGGKEYPADKICTILDTLGGVAYYSEGTSLGIEVCQSGVSPIIVERIQELQTKKEAVFAKELDNLKSNIRTTEHIQWFNVGDRFQPMGVKMIGVFCTIIKDMDILDHTKYLAGFQNVPDIVPGFGEIDFNSTKISMRVSDSQIERIRSGQIPGLNSFLPEATENIGGFSDACHSLSAATTVKIGQEELLINEIEKVLQNKLEGL
jgi:single-stranded-DNA-specific exonuclease